MNLLDWLLVKRPGTLTKIDDRIRISHDKGGNSSLWLNKGVRVPDCYGELQEFYRIYDGADLFGSTFKIASIRDAKKIGNVNITFSLDKICAESETLKIPFPKDSFVFMYQAGIAYYAASYTSNTFFSWDPETGRQRRFTSLFAIVQSWLDAMDETG